MWTFVSYLAALLTTISFLPQAIKTIKTRDTKDLNLLTYIIFVLGTTIWTIYGYLDHETAIFVANFITTLFASVILFYKVKDTIKENKEKAN